MSARSTPNRRRQAVLAVRRAAGLGAVLAGVAGVAGVAGGACRHEMPPAAAPGPRIAGDTIVYAANAPELASLATAAAAPAQIGAMRTSGRLAWDEDHTARVFPPVGGRVTRMLANLEQRVGRGTPLAEIESPDFGQAQADANRARTDLDIAERSLARLKELFEHAAAPRKDLEAAQADRDRARVELERARSHLALLGGSLGTVDQHFVLRSPIDGVVVDRAINPGLEVRTDATAPLFVISDPTRLWVFLDVVEQDLAQVHSGLPLTLRCNAYPRRTFPGRVEVVGDTLDPATRTVKARASLANRERLLKAEMYVEVELADPAARPGIEVPSAAVVTEGTGRYVFVERGPGSFQRRAVTAGAERGGRTQILAGLAAGQPVVTEGSLLLESLLTPGG
jgi:cobalt-zinc-cadmium efflux system membrane fusion protein